MLDAPVITVIHHEFGNRKLEESPGYLEIYQPLVQSGIFKDVLLVNLPENLSRQEKYLKQKIPKIKKLIGQEPVVIYSAGQDTVNFLSLLSQLNVIAIADSDSNKWHRFVSIRNNKIPIIEPEKIKKYANTVLIFNRVYEEDIYNKLDNEYGESLTIFRTYGEKFYEKNRGKHERKIATFLEKNKTDVVFYCPSSPLETISSSFFKKLRKKFADLKFVTCWWDYEEVADSVYLKFERESLSYSDLVIDLSSNIRLERMRSRTHPYEFHSGADKAMFLPSPFCCERFHYRDVNAVYEIAVFGNAFGDRARWIQILDDHYNGPSKRAFHHIGGIQSRGLSCDEYARSLSRTIICVNTQTISNKPQCKGKVREALASGVFLLEEDNEETRSYLEDGQGLVYFNGEKDLKSKIDFYLERPDLRWEVISRGQEFVRKRLNAKVWASSLLRALGLPPLG